MALAKVTDRYSKEDITRFYDAGVWQKATLFDLLTEQAESQPDKVYATDGTSSLTFDELRSSSLRLATGLARLGIRAGDRVAVQIPNWVEFNQIAVALSRLGAIMVPIMPIYRREEVGYVLEHAGVRAAVTSEVFKDFDYADMYRTLRDSCPELRDIIVVRPSSAADAGTEIAFESLLVDVDADTAADEIGPGVGSDDPLVIVYSSGTTARPKGCLHTFNTEAAGSRLLAQSLGYTSADVQFGPSPITHTTGYVTSMLLPLMHGAASHLMPAWEPRAGLAEIAKFHCTMSVTATAFLQMLMDVYDPDEHDASSLRLWVAAGSPIPGAFVERARSLLPQMKVLSLYGRTENLVSTTCTIDDPPERSVTSDGRATAFSTIKVVDRDGVEVPRGVEGDICYRGPSHMLEYIDNPEENAALLTPDGYSRSGDLGVMDEDGYVRVTGRLKDIVIRGGLNISVREVEDLLISHPAIGAVAVVGMPDDRLGEKACCFVVLKDGHETLALDDITAFLADKGLAAQKAPERLEIIDSMPMTATGKVQKHILRAVISEKLASE